MKQCRTWCEALISLLLMKLRLAAQPIPTPEARGFSKKILSSSLSCLEAQAAAENKIKRYHSVIGGWKSGALAKTEENLA